MQYTRDTCDSMLLLGVCHISFLHAPFATSLLRYADAFTMGWRTGLMKNALYIVFGSVAGHKFGCS